MYVLNHISILPHHHHLLVPTTFTHAHLLLVPTLPSSHTATLCPLPPPTLPSPRTTSLPHHLHPPYLHPVLLHCPIISTNSPFTPYYFIAPPPPPTLPSSHTATLCPSTLPTHTCYWYTLSLHPILHPIPPHCAHYLHPPSLHPILLHCPTTSTHSPFIQYYFIAPPPPPTHTRYCLLRS